MLVCLGDKQTEKTMKKQFLVTIEGDIKEDKFTCEQTLLGIIEDETFNNEYGAIKDCAFTVEDVEDIEEERFFHIY